MDTGLRGSHFVVGVVMCCGVIGVFRDGVMVLQENHGDGGDVF